MVQASGYESGWRMRGLWAFLGGLALVLPMAAGCGPKPVAVVQLPPPHTTPRTEGDRVLVVMNVASQESTEIALHYMQRRNIPRENLVHIDTTVEEEIFPSHYRSEIEAKVRENLATNPNREVIDFIVLTKGIPLRITEGGYSVDGHLATFEDPQRIAPYGSPGDPGFQMRVRQSGNPYYGKDEPFSHKKYGFYLVTRLDGYDAGSVIRMIDSSLAARWETGPFFFDGQPRKAQEGAGYRLMQKSLVWGGKVMEKKKGFVTWMDNSERFEVPRRPLMGYVSWGSNDPSFSLAGYRRLEFKPGSIAETFVSTSARTFRRVTGGQSLIGDLIEQGVTGVKGYVSEPYTFALSRPAYLFDRYTKGYTLAESFYMASPVLKWKDVIIGDPLCRPYDPKNKRPNRRR